MLSWRASCQLREENKLAQAAFCHWGDRECLPAASNFGVIPRQALGLEYIHARGIVHHDIKPDNILVNKEGHCVITDFGGARFKSSRTLVKSQDEPPTITPAYAAPELLLDLFEYTESVDYWSLGATIGELVVGGDEVWVSGLLPVYCAQ